MPEVGGVEPALLLLDVVAVLDGLDDGGVGAGPADVLLLQRLDPAWPRCIAGGGWVKCWVGSRSWRSRAGRGSRAGRSGVFLLAGRRRDAAVAVEAEDLALGLEEALGPAVIGRRR